MIVIYSNGSSGHMTYPRENRTSTTMAQAKVTDFFSARKRTTESQPSKRRKLNIVESGKETLTPVELNTRPTRSSTRTKKLVADFTRKNQTASVIDRVPYFFNASNVKGTVNLHEEVTSAWDEHDGFPQTPSKRAKEIDSSDSDSTEFTRKRTRRGKNKKDLDNLTPEKDDVTKQKPRSAKKKLHLKKCVIESSDSNDSDGERNVEFQKDKPVALKMPPAISPLPETPENVRQQLKKVPSAPLSSKVKNAMDLVKKMQQSKGKKKTGSLQENGTSIPVDSIKEKLSKVGGIEDLKARLADMSKTKASLKATIPQLKKFDSLDIKVKTLDSAPKAKEAREKTAPAFERFHSLATPAPPTLSLPYHFKILGEMFRSMDTVVSMLHNRNECCTFSKLKAAVQGMTKRNFDEKKTGQIKTVFPTGYKFSQVKGLPAFGNKTTGYQLCIEANLEDEASTQKPNVKSMFSAQQLLNRKSTFHNKLIAIVKKYHKEFLASLERPLSIPDDKITRWHPKFRLDEVPDVEPAELPKPPELRSYQTAKDVLEQARGKLLPKVEKALETVALKSEVKQEAKPTPAPAKTDADCSKYKGIPQGLLEKIRAKENKKLEMAMMRNPAEDKRKEMLRRLPEMMRILRTHFVTEKKPALTMENVVQKLVDSHRSYMAPASVESHVKLMLEILPEWLKIVQIQKGKYLKMDRNLDLQTITDKVLNLSKS